MTRLIDGIDTAKRPNRSGARSLRASFAHLSPGVHLAGGVHVGEGVLMGVGSAALPNRVIGGWRVPGAGGVVVHDLPPGITAVGASAKPRL